MKKQLGTVSIMWIISLLLMGLPDLQAAYNAEMPITHTSKKALDCYINARTHLENLEMAEAIPLLEQAVKLDPNFALAHLSLAQVAPTKQERTKSLEQAVARIENVSTEEAHLIEFVKAGVEGDASTQRHHLLDLIRLIPNDKRIRELAGSFYFNQNEYGLALTHLMRAVDLDPSYAPPYNLLGYAYIILENNTAAEKSFQIYINLLPDHPNPYDSYGEFLLKTGRYAESIQQYQKALSVDPKFVIALKGVGNNYLLLHNYSEARRVYQQMYDHAVSADIKYQALSSIITSYIYQGQTEMAMHVLDDYITQARNERNLSQEIKAHSISAEIYCEMGQPESGLQEALVTDSLVQQIPFTSIEREFYLRQSKLWRSCALIHNKQYAQAALLLNEVKTEAEQVQNSAQLKEYYYAQGLMYATQSSFESALQSFDLADPNDPLMMYHFAQTNEKAGEIQIAERVYSKLDNWNVPSMGLALAYTNRIKNLTSKY